jgi:hypothetical protein
VDWTISSQTIKIKNEDLWGLYTVAPLSTSFRHDDWPIDKDLGSCAFFLHINIGKSLRCKSIFTQTVVVWECSWKGSLQMRDCWSGGAWLAMQGVDGLGDETKIKEESIFVSFWLFLRLTHWIPLGAAQMTSDACREYSQDAGWTSTHGGPSEGDFYYAERIPPMKLLAAEESNVGGEPWLLRWWNPRSLSKNDGCQDKQDSESS